MKYKNIIEKMSLEQKASLMSGKDFWQTMNIDALNIPSIFLADGPSGVRKQIAAADHLGLNESIQSTCFPTSASVANTWNPMLVETMAAILGAEAVAQKVNVLLGPGINIKRNPLCGRNFEYYSEDPYLAGKMGIAFIKGVQSHGIAACVKHFAANNQEFRRMSIDSVIDERTLREIYLTPFEMAVKEGKTKTVMASYNKVNGIYANEQPHLLVDILRKEWHFDGVVVSDWGGNNDRVKALETTAELEMPTTGGQTNLDIIDAIKSGKTDVKHLDEAVDRLLDLVFTTTKALENSPAKMDVEIHHLMAKVAAEESIVLLKNESQILPLQKATKVAVIGDFAKKARYQGTGSSGVNPSRLDHVLDCISIDDFDLIGYEPGFYRLGKPSKKLIKHAINLAKKADKVVLFLGLDESSEIEGLDRKHIFLPKNQLTLLNALAAIHNQIVVVLSAGSVVDMTWDKQAKGVVHGYLLGQAGARAIVDILVGKVNPSGKLVETYPVSYNDVPSAAYFPGLENTVDYKEGIYVGYRYFDKTNTAVKYPFGYGLSYTKFEYANLDIKQTGVSFTVKNIGQVEGKETAQLYIGKKESLIFRPIKELKGFIKENIRVGETKTYTIPFDEYSFRYFNVLTNRFEIEDGTYQIYIGSSSAHIKLTGELDLKGIKGSKPYDLTSIPSYVSGNIKDVTNDEFSKILGHEVPDSKFVFYKKKRMIIDVNSTIQQLRYSKNWTGRLFAFTIRVSPSALRFFGARNAANIIMMSLYHLPLRGLSRQTGGAISWDQLEGLIVMFNGHFFKGLKQYLKAGKQKRKAMRNKQ